MIKNIKKFSNSIKGNIQEIFAKYYFMSHMKHYSIRKYYSRLLEDEIPLEISVNKNDWGSDGIIEHENNKISLVQVKFRKDNKNKLKRDAINGMGLEALGLGYDKLEYMYLFANTFGGPANIGEHEKKYIKYILFSDIQNCSWDLIQNYVKLKMADKINNNIPTLVKPSPLRDWQKEAKRFILTGRKNNNNDIGQRPLERSDMVIRDFGRKSAIIACGAGKTLFAHSIINARTKNYILYKKNLILVPNLHLLGQWAERLISWEPRRNYLLVGSDFDEANIKDSSPYTLTTDTKIIKNFLEVNDTFINGYTIICTYQSLDKLIAAEPFFNITVADEAHCTCGLEENNFTIVSKPDFPSVNIIYMTATPKIYKGKNETILSMDNKEIYGEQYTYSFRKAITAGIITDYKIVVGYGQGNYDLEFNTKFLCDSINKYKLNSVLVCSTSHEASKELYNSMKKSLFSHELILMNPHASSKDKNKAIAKISTGDPVIIFNVRIFSLGSDIVPLQSVMLLGDRSSVIDTVQTISRALRKHPEKEVAYILIPCLIDNTLDEPEGAYHNVRSIISALGTVDECLKENIILKHTSGKINKYIQCDRIGTWENIENVGNIDEKINDFELVLYNSLCEGREFHTEVLQALLIEFCKAEGRLPKKEEKYKEGNIGIYLCKLLSNKRCKNNREKFLKDIGDISENIKKLIDSRLEYINSEENKNRQGINSEQRQEALVEYCKKFNKLPTQNEVYLDIKVGVFLSMILGGQRCKNNREKFLKDIGDISENIKKLINNRLENKNRRKITPEHRQKALVEYCKKFNKLPTHNELYLGIKVGRFLDMILRGQNYKNKINLWLQELRDISDVLKEALDTRIKNINDIGRKADIKITPTQRYQELLNFIQAQNRVPLLKEVSNNIKIGIFLQELLLGKCYKNQREEWIKNIKGMSENIKKEFEKRENIRADEEKKKSRTLPTEDRLKITIEFIKLYKRLPKNEEIYNNVKIGFFMKGLLAGKRYKSQRQLWLAQLCEISPEINQEIIQRAK